MVYWHSWMNHSRNIIILSGKNVSSSFYFLCFALLKKSNSSNRVLYFCHFSKSKCRTKYALGGSVTFLYISLICCGEAIKDDTLNIGWWNKYKETSSTGSHRSRECSYLDLPNFSLSAMDFILCLILFSSFEMNISTPCFSRSSTSDMSGSRSAIIEEYVIDNLAVSKLHGFSKYRVCLKELSQLAHEHYTLQDVSHSLHAF